MPGTRRATAYVEAAIGCSPLRHASCGAELGVGTRRAGAGPRLLCVTSTLQRISAAQTAGSADTSTRDAPDSSRYTLRSAISPEPKRRARLLPLCSGYTESYLPRELRASRGTACASRYHPSPDNGLGCYRCAPAIPRDALRETLPVGTRETIAPTIAHCARPSSLTSGSTSLQSAIENGGHARPALTLRRS